MKFDERCREEAKRLYPDITPDEMKMDEIQDCILALAERLKVLEAKIENMEADLPWARKTI